MFSNIIIRSAAAFGGAPFRLKKCTALGSAGAGAVSGGARGGVTLLGKLNFTADYFYKVTDDILLKLNVPLTIGMSAPQQNAGKVENRGWDLGINYANSIGDFNYKLAFNLSDVKNKANL